MFQVRRATSADSAEVGRLLYDFNAEFETATDPVAVLGERLARLLAADQVVVVLAEAPRTEGERTELPVVGFALWVLRPNVWFDGLLAHLDELYVAPLLRDQGIGSALLELSRVLLQELGAAEIHVSVDEVDLDARRFYERHGFSNLEDGSRVLLYVGPAQLQRPSATT